MLNFVPIFLLTYFYILKTIMSLAANNSQKKTILVGMSGGVDSSVTALLLKEQGHHVEGVFMKNWEEDDTETYCPASIDMADAQAVCDQLQIELHRVNFAEEYWERVFTHFLAEYQAGRTPNPDILCNKEIKFKAFLQFAKQHGADYIATGHYARNRENEGKFALLKGLDNQKDQSYFLHMLDQSQLRDSLFPIGELNKETVRTMANKAGLKNHAKKDSTGICFIGERKFKQFLNNYLPAKPGPIETIEGKVIGQHDGLMFYTLGQRQGLQIGGQKNSLQEPWYVVAKNIPHNKLIVTQGSNHPSLFANTLWTQSIHWISAEAPTFPFTTHAKTRYRQTEQACIINQIDDNQYRIDFNDAQRALTPGQSVVFYQNDVCLGGGIITHATI
jgi:tRNA-specific 2-thiouridylase